MEEELRSSFPIWRWGIALLIAILVVFCIYTVWTVKHLKIALSPITDEDRQKFGKFAELLKTIERYPHREVDVASVGSPAIEYQLQVVDELVNVFESRFGHLPDSIAELPRIVSHGPGEKQAVEEIKEETENCRIFRRSSDSYLLNCDGWNPDESSLQSLEKSFDQEKEKFCRIDRHILLYAPPPRVRHP